MSEINDLNDQLFQKWDDEIAARRDQLMKAAAIQWYQEDKASKEGLQAQKDEAEVQERKTRKLEAAQKIPQRTTQKIKSEDLIWQR